MKTIRGKLLLAFFLVAFIPLLISTYHNYTLSQVSLEHAIEQLSQSSSHVRSSAEQLGNSLAEIKNTFSQYLYLSSFSSFSRGDKESYLRTLLSVYPSKISFVLLLDARGEVLIQIPRPSDLTPLSIRKLQKMGNKNFYEGEVLQAPNGQYRQDLVYRIQDGRGNTTFVIITLNLSRFFDELPGAPAGSQNAVYIVDQEGRVLNEKHRSPVSRPGQSPSAEITQTHNLRIIRNYIPVSGTRLWMVAEQPLPADRGKLTFLLWILLAALIGVLGSFVLSRRISKPILALRKSAEVFGTGHLEVPVAGVKGEDEIASLSSSFENMRRSLKETLGRYEESLHTQKILYEKVRQRLEEISTLHRIAVSLSSTLSMEEVMQQSLREMVQTFKAESGALFLWDEEERALSLRETFGVPRHPMTVRPSEGIAGIILTRNAPLLVEDLEEKSMVLPEPMVRRNVRSLLGTPLLVKEKCIGTVEVHHSYPSFFKEEALKLFEVMASSLAMAIDNARLYKELRDNLERRMVELFTLYDVSQVVSSSLDLSTILDRVVELVLQTLRADGTCVTLVESGHHRVHLSRDCADDLKRECEAALSRPVIVASLSNGIPLLLRRVEDHLECGNFLRLARPVHALGLVPILLDGGLIGSLGAFFHDKHRFTDEESRLLFFLASQVALALRNARLYKDAVEEKEKLDSILSSMSDGVITLSKDFEILSGNAAAEHALGYREDEMRGRRFSEILHTEEERQGWFEQSMREEFTTELRNTRYLELPVRVRDHSEKFLSVALSPLRDEGGEFVGAVLVFRDISKIKEIEQMKSDFISTVSHELRTPLTSIKGYIATLLHPSTKFDGSTQRDFLKIMNREADRLSGLITDLLEVSKIESEKFRMNPRPLNLPGMVRGLVEKCTQINRKHVFEVEAPEALEVIIDSAQIEYVLHHLLGNAVKYSPKGGTVHVEVRALDDKVYVSVKDEGIGIPFDEQEKIFDRFYRIDNRPTRWAYGWGLGLFIARKVVEAHGGHIWVESVLGGGSKFTFTLPLVTREENIDGERRTSSHSGR